ncbi:hypothetical protein Bbelb_218280 [Branchiostoma belcheri]|nr:hypothetical protein Bbelb_218280 [Branchiostoma belcheri]
MAQDPYKHKTFVVKCKTTDTIARVRAHMLYSLYDMGRVQHQFRFRYKGQYLRDPYTMEECKIVDHAVITMVPMAKRQESLVDLQQRLMESTDDLDPSHELDLGKGQTDEVMKALEKEMKIFSRREKMLAGLEGLLTAQMMLILLAVFTHYWYSIFWSGVSWLYGYLRCPKYSRVGGFTGIAGLKRKQFCVVYGIMSLINFGVSLGLGIYTALNLVSLQCLSYPTELGTGCTHAEVYTAGFYFLHALVMLCSNVLTWIILHNFKYEVGDLIEKALVLTRDIEKVMEAARTGKVKERRTAAYEMATMAASGDDNKFRIVAEGGLELLIAMGLSTDAATQEYSTEAMAELLTVPAIQDKFVEMGGVRTLTAVLHAHDQRVVKEAATALSYIVSDSEENKPAIVADHGLEDLCHAARHGGKDVQSIVSGVFLELAFNPDIRAQMASLNSPAQALVHLCRSSDTDTQRFALQTLELLAIESSSTISAQEELLDYLLSLPVHTMDTRLYLLAGKILLYFTETQETQGRTCFGPPVAQDVSDPHRRPVHKHLYALPITRGLQAGLYSLIGPQDDQAAGLILGPDPPLAFCHPSRPNNPNRQTPSSQSCEHLLDSDWLKNTLMHCEHLLDSDRLKDTLLQFFHRLKDTLFQFSRTSDLVLQKVTAKIILALIDTPHLLMRAQHLGFQDIFLHIRNNALDRDAWNMADQGLALMQSEHAHKAAKGIMGSQGSLKDKGRGSFSSGRSQSTTSLDKGARPS